MPNWKKLIVSGSDALLNSLNVSNDLTVSGDIAIGSSPPSSAALGVDGNIKGTGYLLLNDSNNQYIYATPTGRAVEIYASSSVTSGDPAFRIRQDNATKVDFGWDDDGTSEAFVWNYSNGGFKIGTNSTERFKITADGKVGIGFTSPVNQLDVNGVIMGTGIRFGSQASGEGIMRVNGTGNGNGLAFTTGNFSSNYVALYVDHSSNNGKVGIGTTAPTKQLQVIGDISGSDVYINGWNSVSASLSTHAQSLVNNINGSGTADYVARFSDADTLTTGIIQDDGSSVGINAGPSSKTLYVNGTGQFTGEVFVSHLDIMGSSASRLRDDVVLRFGTDRRFGLRYNSTADKLQFISSSNTIVSIDGDGSTGIEGDLTVNGTITLGESSNEIIKSNGSIRLNIDSNNDQTDRIFIVSTGANSEVFRVSETGYVTAQSTLKSQVGILALGNDVTLFRDGANILRTDDTLHANNSLHVGGDGKIYDRANTSNFIELADTVNISTDTSVTGDLTVTGNITAQEFHTEFVSASIIYESGSTKFGDTSDDTHSFTGSVALTGSGITIKDPVTPSINLIDETNGLSFKFRSANNYGYIDIDQGDSVGSSRLQLRTDGYDFLYGDQNQNVYIRSGSLTIGTASGTGKFNSYISDTRQLTHNGNGGDFSILSDNNTAPVFYVKGTGTADLVNIFDNTTEVFTILDGGNVGVGNTSPLATLTVGSGAGSLNTAAELFVPNNDALMRALKIGHGSSVATIMTDDNTKPMAFNSGGSERMRISSAGALKFNSYGSGNNTGTLAYTLGVDSSGNILEFSGGSGGSVSSITNGADNRIATFTGADSLNGEANLTFDGDIFAVNTNNLYVSASRVGIGTTSPAGILDVQTNADSAQLVRFWNRASGTSAHSAVRIASSANNANSARLEFSDASYYTATIAGDRVQGLTFRTKADGTDPTSIPERMRITPTGAVGINISNPNEKLHVEGTTRFNGDVHIGTSASGFTYRPQHGGNHTDRYFLMFDYTNGASYPFLTNRTPSGDVAIMTGTAAGGGENEHFRIKGGDGTVDAYFTNTNVGIGTTSPARNLHIHQGDSTLSYLQITNTTTGTGGGDGVSFGITSDEVAIWNNRENTDTSISTNNTERIRIKNDGKVGIGTNSPAEILHIQGSANGNVKALIENTNTGTNAYATLGFQSDENHSVQPAIFLNGANNTNYAGASSLNMYQHGNFPLGFVTSNQIRMTVTGAGNVGIGTVTPSAKLDVHGRVDFANDFRLRGNDSSADQGVVRFFVDSNNKLSIDTVNDGNNLFVIDSSGNVGIGSNTPARKLDVNGEIQNNGIFRKGGNVIIKSTGSETMFGPGGSGIITFHNSATMTTGDETMRIDANGNLLLNNTSAGARLDIREDSNYAIRAEDASGHYFRVNTGGDVDMRGDLTVQGIITAQEFHTEFVSASIIHQSGSSQFGDTSDDNHDFTGSVNVSGSMVLTDNTKLQLGSNSTAGDLRIFHTGTVSKIANNTGDLEITQFVDDGDIKFISDDGSGGTAEYFRLDGGLGYSVASKHIQMVDGRAVYYGSGNDLGIYHSSNNSFIENITGDLTIQNNTDDGDIVFKSDNGSGGLATYLIIDGGSTNVQFPKDVFLYDNVKLNIGGSFDLRLFHDGSNSYVQAQGTGNLIIQQTIDDKDIIFKSDNGSGGVTEYFRLDGSEADGTYTYTSWGDGDVISLGGSKDLRVWHDPNTNSSYIRNYTNHLFIENSQDDGDIIFKSDNGSGGTAEYFRVDGGIHETVFSKSTRHMDNVHAKFGSGEDLKIYHTGAHSFITAQSGTGSLYIRPGNGNTVQIEDKDSNDMITAAPTGVRLLYNSSEKLTTTNTGITVTGDIDADDITIDDWGSVSASLSAIQTAGGVNGTGTANDLAMWSDSDTLTDAPIAINGNNATFAGDITTNGDITIDNSSGDPFLKLKTTAQEYVVRIDQSDSEKFQIRDTTNSATRLTIDTSGTATFHSNLTTLGSLTVGDSNADSAQIGRKHLLGYCENTDVDTGTETIKELALATYQAVFFDYVVKNGTNLRAGTVTAVHDGTNVEFTDTSTKDLGDTSGVTLSVDISGSNMRLRATTTSDNWIVKANIRGIKV